MAKYEGTVILPSGTGKGLSQKFTVEAENRNQAESMLSAYGSILGINLLDARSIDSRSSHQGSGVSNRTLKWIGLLTICWIYPLVVHWESRVISNRNPGLILDSRLTNLAPPTTDVERTSVHRR